MQQYQHRLSPRPSASISTSTSVSRSIYAGLLLLLFVTNTLAISIPQIPQGVTPARSIPPRHALLNRQTPYNWTQSFINECGDNFIDCGNFHCCKAGNECLTGSQSGAEYCRSLTNNSTTSTPAATASPSPSSSKKVPIGAIIGGVFGGLGLIATAFLIFYFHRRSHPPVAPAVPQAPIPNLPNVIEAKYPPTHDASYSGDKWLPGSFLYHNRNRSISATSNNGVGPDGYVHVNSQDHIIKDQIQPEPPQLAELPTTAPTVELPGDEGYFASKPISQQQQQLPPTSPTETTPMAPRASIGRSPTNVKQFWRKSRGS
ncbi:hypothetical protein TWF696_008227 [Orbilia brochopaga]|uniref:Uncharacterized protein n=1 Tax=Orbilia brochopaga TaxID=3140254 RepID=A0AAV9UGP3_9PEZI